MTTDKDVSGSQAHQTSQSPAEQGDSSLAKEPGQRPPFLPTLPPLETDGLGRRSVEPAQIDWKRVSPKYLRVRMIQRAIWSLILLLPSALPLFFTEVLHWWNWPLWLSATLLGLMALYQIWLTLIVARQVRALGYSVRADHLLTSKGIMFRSVRAVPYGRIQYVDVSSGPVENAVGLCHLQVKTAGSYGVTLPGLERPQAERLREVLTDLSDAKMVGL